MKGCALALFLVIIGCKDEDGLALRTSKSEEPNSVPGVETDTSSMSKASTSVVEKVSLNRGESGRLNHPESPTAREPTKTPNTQATGNQSSSQEHTALQWNEALALTFDPDADGSGSPSPQPLAKGGPQKSVEPLLRNVGNNGAAGNVLAIEWKHDLPEPENLVRGNELLNQILGFAIGNSHAISPGDKEEDVSLSALDTTVEGLEARDDANDDPNDTITEPDDDDLNLMLEDELSDDDGESSTKALQSSEKPQVIVPTPGPLDRAARDIAVVAGKAIRGVQGFWNKLTKEICV
jgi:hypothetical protein